MTGTGVKDVEEEYGNTIITINVLAKAIQNGLRRPKRMLSFEEAMMTATHVLNFFGFGDRIIDNMLEPEDRDTFYMLEDLDILETEREETTLWDGREWRIHYWVLNKERIWILAKGEVEEEPVVEDISEVYEELPDEIWARN